MDLETIFTQKELFDLKEIHFYENVDEKYLIATINERTSKTPTLFSNEQLKRILRKKIFAENQIIANKLYEHIVLANELFLKLKSIAEKLTDLTNKNKIIKLIRLNKTKKEATELGIKYNEEIRKIKEEFENLKNATYELTSQSINSIQKELPFIYLTQTTQTLQAIRLLPEIREKYEKEYEQIKMLLSRMYSEIPLITFVKLMHYARDSQKRRTLIKTLIKINHIRPRNQKIFYHQMFIEHFLDEQTHEFISLFVNVFERKTNFLISFINKHGTKPEIWHMLLKLIQNKQYSEPNVIKNLKTMSTKALFLDSNPENYKYYAIDLITNILTPQLTQLITECGIHKIHNEEEKNIVKKIKEIYYQNKFTNKEIAKKYKQTISNPTRHITSLYYFIKIMNATGLDFFKQPMTLGELRDIATLPDNTIKMIQKRKNIFAIIASEDHNGAFAQTIEVLNGLPKELFKVNYVFCGNKGDGQYEQTKNKTLEFYTRIITRPLRKAIYAISEIGKIEKINYLVIAGHGEPRAIDVLSLNINSTTIKTPLFKSIEQHLAKDAKIILLSCSTGKQIDGKTPIAKEIAQTLNRTVIAPTQDAAPGFFEYDDEGNILDVDYGFRNGSKVASIHFR